MSTPSSTSRGRTALAATLATILVVGVGLGAWYVLDWQYHQKRAQAFQPAAVERCVISAGDEANLRATLSLRACEASASTAAALQDARQLSSSGANTAPWYQGHEKRLTEMADALGVASREESDVRVALITQLPKTKATSGDVVRALESPEYQREVSEADAAWAEYRTAQAALGASAPFSIYLRFHPDAVQIVPSLKQATGAAEAWRPDGVRAWLDARKKPSEMQADVGALPTA